MNSIYERRKIGARWYPITFLRFKREVWAGITPGSRALETVLAAWRHGESVTVGEYEYRHRIPETT